MKGEVALKACAAKLAKAATDERFKLRLATADQRNGYEVGWFEGYLAARSCGWEDISTAPKDRWILCAEDNGPDHPFDAYAAHWNSGGYWMANCGQYVTSPPEPTHWMPLPSLPGGGM